jgi:hypothetical protein
MEYCMTQERIDQMLSPYKEDDYTVKLLRAVYGVIPGSPAFQFYNSFEGGLRRIHPDLSEAELAQARQIAAGGDFQSALTVLGYIDTGDKLLAGYAGLKNVLNFFGMGSSGPQKRTFESDPQQTIDAGVKALAIAFATYQFLPGDLSTKVKSLKDIPAGVELLIYYGAIEVALPFADNVMEAGGNVISQLMKSGGDIKNKFSAIPGAGSVVNAQSMLDGMTSMLDRYVVMARDHVNTIAAKIKDLLPAVTSAADSITGAVASGADLLPVWSFLGGRFAAEAAAYRIGR